MPKIIDSQARREEIAHAVWSIAAREGINAATIRAVAAECDLSVGAIQYSFKSQASLQQFAMEIIVQRISHRLDTFKEIQEKPIRSVVVAALLQLLPLDNKRELEARVWIAFFNAALTNKDLAPYATEIDSLITLFCRNCLACLEAPSNNPEPYKTNAPSLDERAITLHALLDGLTLRILTNPSSRRRKEAQQAIEAYIDTL